MEKLGNIEAYALDNGLNVHLFYTPTNTIFGRVRTKIGGLHEKKGEEGIAHFLEHVIINAGSKKYSPKEQKNIRASLGYTNANTNRERTMFPAGMNSNQLEIYLDYASDMVFHPRLDPKGVNQERKRVLREISDYKGNSFFTDWKIFQDALARNSIHPYFVLGNEDVVNSVTPENLGKFHERKYSTSNSDVILVGGLPKNTKDLIAKYFEKKSPGKKTEITYPKVTSLKKQTFIHTSAKDLLRKDSPEKSNSDIYLGVVVPSEKSQTSPTIKVLNEILGVGSTSRLHDKISRELGLAYYIGSYYDGDDNFGNVVINGSIDNKGIDQAKKAIFEEIHKLKEDRVSKKELADAKSRLKYRTSSSVDGAWKIILGRDPLNIQKLSQLEKELDTEKSIKDELSEIDSVTLEEIQKAAQLYLPEKNGNYVFMVRDPLKES